MNTKLAFVALAVSAAVAQTQTVMAQSLPAPDSQIVAEAEAKLADAQRCDLWIRSAVSAIEKRAKINNVSPHEMKLGSLSLADIKVMKEEQGKCAAAAAITNQIQSIANRYSNQKDGNQIDKASPGLAGPENVQTDQLDASQKQLAVAAKAMNKGKDEQSAKESELRDSYKNAARAMSGQQVNSRNQISNSDLKTLEKINDLTHSGSADESSAKASHEDVSPELSQHSKADSATDDVVVITTNPKEYENVPLTAIFQ